MSYMPIFGGISNDLPVTLIPGQAYFFSSDDFKFHSIFALLLYHRLEQSDSDDMELVSSLEPSKFAKFESAT